MSESLTLYTRTGCPLCEEMEDAVRRLLDGSSHTLTSVDVDADPDLQGRFGWDVPLLFHGGNEICRHHFDPFAVQAWLRGHSQTA